MFTGYIYKITCLINGKVYIGQTVQEIKTRLYHHMDDAINKKYKYGFANAIRKHGKQNFICEEIERHCRDTKKELKNALDEAEKKYIRTYNSYLRGYNSTLGGDGTIGYKPTAEWKAKVSIKNKGKKRTKEFCEMMSKRMAGRRVSQETKEKLSAFSKANVSNSQLADMVKKAILVVKKPVAQYDGDGSFVKRYESVSEAERETGINGSTICMCCNGKRRGAGGYFWTYAGRDVPLMVTVKEKPRPNTISVYQYDRNNVLINAYCSITQAARATATQLTSIVENCKGKRKSAGGFVWSYQGSDCN